MRKLTIEAIRKNPSAILTHELPDCDDSLLLEIAYLAAKYISESEELLSRAARSGSYTPRGWKWSPGLADIHEESEAISFNAECVGDEIADIYEGKFFGARSGIPRIHRYDRDEVDR